MDVTTVNDRHLHQGWVVVQDGPEGPAGSSCRGGSSGPGPAGWLTVMADRTEDAEIELHPVERVLAVTDLREVGVPATTRVPGGEHRPPRAPSSAPVTSGGDRSAGTVLCGMPGSSPT